MFSWYATRWYMGNFVAEFAPRMEENQLEAALAAVNLAPDDPWTHWVVAGLKKRSLLPGDLEEAVRHYEEAVRLSPNDYRFWMDLGRAREQLGDRSGGEKALRRAVELAPSYTYPHWYLGNLLLRAGRGEEAFAELRFAAEADAKLRPALFDVAWTLYDQNIEEIRKVVGNTAVARAQFAVYLAGRDRLEDALNLWSGLTDTEKREQSERGSQIMKNLLAAKRFRLALKTSNELNPGAGSTKPSQFTNGGFENDIDTAAENDFAWRITPDPQAQIAIDGSMRHGGSRSLRILFKSSSRLSFNNVAQLVVVEPATQYRFECYAKAQDLKSAGTPLIEIIDASDGKSVLAVSQPLASGSYDWLPVAITFKTPPTTDGITVRIARTMCGTDEVCPIFGMVWYDDFSLQSVAGASAQ